MARTMKRQPFSVSTSSSDYAKPQMFNQVEFKGLCDKKNDISIDQETFSDVKNVYLDESGVLVSRPPFKFENDEGYIVDEWQIGSYHLRLYRLLYLVTTKGEEYESEERAPVEGNDFVDANGNHAYYYRFWLHCVSHNVSSERCWRISASDIGKDWVPDVACTPIEDKIFIWFAGIDFLVLNTAELCFEDAAKHLYLPVHEIVTSGIETDNESKNFLTDAYRRRYLYSTLSSVDFTKLQGKYVQVGMIGNGGSSNHLYDIDLWHGERENLLIYPLSYIGDSVYVDVASTPEGMVYLRHSSSFGWTEISFDGTYFRRLPQLDEQIGNPLLTKDGFDVIAFTRKGLARCKIALSSITDASDDLFKWSIDRFPFEFNSVDEVCGYFDTAQNFVYILNITRQSEKYTVIHAEHGTGTNVLKKTLELRENDGHYFTFDSNTCKPIIKYIAPTGTSLAGDIPHLIVFVPYTGEGNRMCFSVVWSGDTGVAYNSNSFDTFMLNTREVTVASVVASDAYIYGFRRLIDESADSVFLGDMEIYIPTVVNVAGRVGTFTGLRHDMRRRISISLRFYKGYSNELSIGASEFDVIAETSNYIVAEKDYIGEVDMPIPYTNGKAKYITDKYYLSSDDINDAQELPDNGRLANITKCQPLLYDSTGITYNIDGYLWTSMLISDVALELDEYVNTVHSLSAGTLTINVASEVPTSFITMNEHYFAFLVNTRQLLEVTSTRRDENELSFLLYLPKQNEQIFTDEITNLHPLSNTEIGVFTENNIWYITSITGDDGTISYSKPIKSKIPFGCRKGNSVITALDGQAIIFPTQRGVTALAPQDFIATTEKTLTYLSDTIQSKYENFYNTSIFNMISVSNSTECKPFIHIITHKYWIMFYKHLGKELLLLDTRGGTWWTLNTPYPILSVSTEIKLRVLMQIDYLPTQNKTSLLGVSFVLTESGEYFDDVIANTLNGDGEVIVENEFMTRSVLKPVSSIIDWRFASQKLHFNQINNYKAIKGLVLNLKGTDTMTAKLSTKVYRDTYHPEESDIVEIKINELRTFINRFNLLHTINFQYMIENDKEADTQHQFQLNSLGIKYEVKERIR